jgi:hypothetical protein
LKKHLITLAVMLVAGTARSADPLLDYETLSHAVSIESLRAGSHDPSGTNDYYFVADMYSLVNSSEERNLEFAKRKKIKIELGNFGETQIDSLKTWKSDGKVNDKTLTIAGDTIRKLAAQSMQEFKVQESEIAVMVEITMFEKAKKYYFFGEDTQIAKTEYFPISQTKYEKTNDHDLTLQDDKGTQVILRIHYKASDDSKDRKQAGN